MISGYRRYARIALAVAFLALACMVFPHASIASANDGISDVTDVSTPLPETGPPATSIPVVPPATEQPPPPTSEPAPEPTQAPVVPPAPESAPIVEPPAPEPEPIVKEPAVPVVEEPVYEVPVPEVVEPEPTTAAPTTAEPTTAAPVTGRATFGSPLKETATAEPVHATSVTTLPPGNPVYLQLLVIGVLLAIGFWYLRFMKRGGKRLGTGSASPVK